MQDWTIGTKFPDPSWAEIGRPKRAQTARRTITGLGRALAAAVLLVATAAAAPARPAGTEGKDAMQEPSRMESKDRETVTLGGGCFWCLEAIYRELAGVDSVTSGYSGGTVKNPSYQQVCTGETGHVEVVQLVFDPATISLEDILRVFFTIHDPTTLNRQGADVGTQYRSVIFYRDAAQKEAAEKVLAEIREAGVWDDPIVTQVVPFEAFYPAEDYHARYFERNANQPYCQVVIAPKVAKFRKHFQDRLKKK